MQFKELQLIEPILKSVKEQGYENATDIQAKAIPIILDRKDVLGSAQTGTGKTAAFSIPIIQHLENAANRNKLNTLILTPTRELAIQIGENISLYSKYTNIKNTVIFGGVKQGKQAEAIRKGVDILIATPGRLLDLMNQGIVNLKNIEYFVLDEADRMLDMGFINDIKKVLAVLPKKRQSLFFSATMPKNIVDLSNKILIKPIKIEVSPVSSTAETIQQYLYYTNKATKTKLLLHILKDERMDQVLVFAQTKHGSDRIVKNLQQENITIAAIHGNKSQNQRQKALKEFKEGSIRVLVATDIAARGIDIDKLKYVINYDIPNVAETYVHRIGRSGRAGEEGVAISMCEAEENVDVRAIEKLTKQKIQVIKENPFPQTDRTMTPQEKKQFEREKLKKKQEYFANKKKNGGGRSGQGGGRSSQGGGRSSQGGGRSGQGGGQNSRGRR